MKRALITGITGQDGSFLAEFLLERGYEVFGFARSESWVRPNSATHLSNKINVLIGDMSEGSDISLALQESKPDEIYNLGAMSHVRVSFEMPEYTANVDGIGTLRVLEAVRLLQLVARCNAGLDPVEGSLPDGPTLLFPGAAADPQSPSWSGLASRVRRKQAAGARFLQTQMVMDGAALGRFVEEITAPLGLPVLAGVFLLKSARNARFINRVVPGASIPEAVIARLEGAKDPAAEGVAIAAEQVHDYRSIAQGVHLMAVKAEERIPLILDQAGIQPLA
jgi:hypothetical protein